MPVNERLDGTLPSVYIQSVLLHRERINVVDAASNGDITQNNKAIQIKNQREEIWNLFCYFSCQWWQRVGARGGRGPLNF